MMTITSIPSRHVRGIVSSAVSALCPSGLVAALAQRQRGWPLPERAPRGYAWVVTTALGHQRGRLPWAASAASWRAYHPGMRPARPHADQASTGHVLLALLSCAPGGCLRLARGGAEACSGSPLGRKRCARPPILRSCHAA